MSVNSDWNGLEFISTIEHRQYPFYGVQFHPEKNLYEWVRNKNISHTAHAIEASQYFAQFFVNEARKSDHRFADSKTEDQYVIYNYPCTFTGAVGSAFEQAYMFPSKVDYMVGDKASFADGTYLGLIISLSVLNFIRWCKLETKPLRLFIFFLPLPSFLQSRMAISSSSEVFPRESPSEHETTQPWRAQKWTATVGDKKRNSELSRRLRAIKRRYLIGLIRDMTV